MASEDESIMGAGLQKMRGGRSDWEMEALNAVLLEKSNDRGERICLNKFVDWKKNY